ncbi:hypothetical protein [Pseudomonas kitaguniensis]|nr:hypothetical protein [Pseudomonas kitaguniensis]
MKKLDEGLDEGDEGMKGQLARLASNTPVATPGANTIKGSAVRMMLI